MMNVGELAPDFVLKDQDSQDFTLSANKGKQVFLSFHPLAWTDVCSRQMRALEDFYETFLAMDTVPVGISCDPVPSKKAWALHLKIDKLRILSDFWPHGKVSQLYGVFRETHGTSQRANIVLDAEHRIRWVKVYPISQLPDIQEVLNVLRGIYAGGAKS